MKATNAVVVTGASAVILTAGFIAAPNPGGNDTDESAMPSPTPEGNLTSATGADDGAASESPADSGADETSDLVSGTFDGPVVNNIRGDYQVRLTFDQGVLVEVEFPVAGTEAPESRFINEDALPQLAERFVEAQDWDVDYVSGASFTSPAMVESAQGAFEDAGV